MCFFFFNCQVFWFCFGCAGSSLLHGLCSSCGEWGLLSSCGSWTPPLWPLFLQSMGSGAQAQWLWLMGLAPLQHMRSSRIRTRPRVSCIGRWILSHGAIREPPGWVSLWRDLFLFLFSSKCHFWASFCSGLLLPLSWMGILTSLYPHLALSHGRAPIYSSPEVSASTHILFTLQSLNPKTFCQLPDLCIHLYIHV